MRKGGFEPPRLSAPPPQDGVSASSTTSAKKNCFTYNALALPCSALSAASRPSPQQFRCGSRLRMRLLHRDLNVIVSGYALQGVGDSCFLHAMLESHSAIMQTKGE